MNPGLVVKLRPAGPWRIGPDSGARNRVDAIYHSDSLYSAVTSAMARLGSLEEWLDATARATARAPRGVSFSSCFPFLDEIGFVVPPRTIWPPTSPALMSARVRWKSARFVPLAMVQAMLAGRTLDENQWSVDGASQCLVPAGRPGPFRTGVRWNAAVDRLTGATERHSTACLEFRAGRGPVDRGQSFADEAARERWLDPVKAAFRFWPIAVSAASARAAGAARRLPEFIEGTLPEMILPPEGRAGKRPRSRSNRPRRSRNRAPEPPPLEEPARGTSRPLEEPPARSTRRRCRLWTRSRGDLTDASRRSAVGRLAPLKPPAAAVETPAIVALPGAAGRRTRRRRARPEPAAPSLRPAAPQQPPTGCSRFSRPRRPIRWIGRAAITLCWPAAAASTVPPVPAS